jgi:hypothetical protein
MDLRAGDKNLIEYAVLTVVWIGPGGAASPQGPEHVNSIGMRLMCISPGCGSPLEHLGLNHAFSI